MTSPTRLLLCLPVLAQAACLDLTPPTIAERRFERAFRVAAGSVVRVDLSGGSVSTVSGPDGIVEVVVIQQVRSSGGERAADELLSATNVSATQAGNEIRVQRRIRDVVSRAGGGSGPTCGRSSLCPPTSVSIPRRAAGG
jgi:hypothetical protein